MCKMLDCTFTKHWKATVRMAAINQSIYRTYWSWTGKDHRWSEKSGELSRERESEQEFSTKCKLEDWHVLCASWKGEIATLLAVHISNNWQEWRTQVWSSRIRINTFIFWHALRIAELLEHMVLNFFHSTTESALMCKCNSLVKTKAERQKDTTEICELGTEDQCSWTLHWTRKEDHLIIYTVSLWRYLPRGRKN